MVWWEFHDSVLEYYIVISCINYVNHKGKGQTSKGPTDPGIGVILLLSDN